ncbi:acyltransferase [Corynebacterium mucifaciens]|uniref:Peptidoglycan/LPS O-acetylase OafA/YrhL n=1 Tax=Corynebacterium mucifaciens TaxID=57171 RepID=A0ABV2NYG3_9CORY
MNRPAILPELDGLRAVAAYGIVATHVAFQTATGSAVLERFDYFVAVFFALSAFLLSRGGLRGGYYSRRVARLAPAYVVCVAVVLLALPPLAGVTWGQAAANLLLVQVYVPHSLIDGLTQMWSLCIEAAFYVVLPLYLRLDGRGRRAALAGSVVLGLAWPWAVSGISDPAVLNMQIWPPSYAPWFAVGLLLAELERAGVRYAGPRWPFPVLALPVAWVAGVIGPRGLEHPSPAEFNVRVLLGAVFAALVVAPYALGQRFVGTVLSSPVMRTLGRWSYSVFLWHMAVLYFVFPVLGVQVFSGRFMLVFAATALASTAVAYMSYELVEVPGGRLVRQATAKQPATMRKVEEPA